MDKEALAALRPPSFVEVELWTREGKRIADITHLVRNYFAAEERNEAEQLQFSMDYDAFERYMALDVGADTVSNFREGQTEIKVKEFGQYKFGTQLVWAPINLNKDGSATISVTATGYLNFMNDRYPTPGLRYEKRESVEIFYDLIRTAQAVSNGNNGLIIPTSGYYVTGVPRDREYGLYTSSTKLNMQRLTSYVAGRFDFRILHNKTVMTYPSVGSPRADFKLTYDRKHNRSTFDEALLNRGASQLFNQIHGIGSGLGGETLTRTVTDEESALDFRLRELPVQFNEVSEEATLIENAHARRERVKDLVRMPQVTLSEADLPANGIHIGDVVPVEFIGGRLIEAMSGHHRIERIETTRDENGFAAAINLFFEKTSDIELND